MLIGSKTQNVISSEKGLTTETPIITIAASVNERATVQGVYTSSVGSTVIIKAVNGTISNHNEVAKTFNYTAYDITNGINGLDTITAYATKAGELKSEITTANITVMYVPSVADTTIQVVDIFNDLQTNTGFIGV